MYGIFHIRSVSVGLDNQIWYLFIYITGYLNVRKISEMMEFRTFVGPLNYTKLLHIVLIGAYREGIWKDQPLHLETVSKMKLATGVVLDLRNIQNCFALTTFFELLSPNLYTYLPGYQCYQYTDEDRDALSRRGSSEKQVCEGHGNIFSQGNDDLAPGCGGCFCCQPTPGKLSNCISRTLYVSFPLSFVYVVLYCVTMWPPMGLWSYHINSYDLNSPAKSSNSQKENKSKMGHNLCCCWEDSVI